MNVENSIIVKDDETNTDNELSRPIKKIVQATSVASEQMFSIAKFTISPTRNRLEPEKACASLCLKTWFAMNLIKDTENDYK
ncbi:6651_t:CDS:2 [Gigaspora margarita]|uniref:6651_t:CDS:1 n=1 Tax=Gigaspora margarita TaxID=4874 RepID=A0ABN7VDJ8_GIGMA|nr:6651_t:CDS:2 [Gigaspora margarita]